MTVTAGLGGAGTEGDRRDLGPDLDGLIGASAAAGVATTYVDGCGERRDVPDSTLRAVLHALGPTSAPVRPEGRAAPPATRPFARCAPGPQPTRTWGVFSPVSALVSSRAADAGGGDLTALRALADMVLDAGGRVVATLPLVACRPEEASPYSPLTRRWWDERWVDPAWVARRVGLSGWIDPRPRPPVGSFDTLALYLATREALVDIYSRIGGPRAELDELTGWRAAHRGVERWGRWKAAASVHGFDPWTWPVEVAESVRDGASTPTSESEFEVFAQWAVSTQLRELGRHLSDNGAALYLDLPLGAPGASYDVWERPGAYLDGVSIGAPPDAFFPEGQVWGLRPPHPRPDGDDPREVLRECLVAHAEVCGLLRIDHVMGLHRLFVVPDGTGPEQGTYVDFPADDLWDVVAEVSQRHDVGIVGEDLGTVPAEVRDSMAARGARGLFIGQDECRAPFRLQRLAPSHSVASLNTHDLEPFASWHDRTRPALDASVVRDHLLAELAAGDADVVLVSMGDLLLDGRRLNVPGTVGDGNWRIRWTTPLDEMRSTFGTGVLADIAAWRATPRGAWPKGATPRLDDADIESLRAGTHARLADRLGIHPFTARGMVGCAASVWAPSAQAVRVAGDFDGWGGTPLRLSGLGGEAGVWDGFLPAAVLGDRYKLRIQGRDGVWREKADPFARSSELPPANASIITADAPADHEWLDAGWMANRGAVQAPGAPMSIYELHIGSWRHHGDGRVPTYRELAPWLVDYVVSMGFTHVELMPVMEHPFGGSWGYHVTGYFAPTSRYGTPGDFAWLVDQLHAAGIGVILDWVPAHFPDDAHGLADFDGGPLFEHPDPREGRHAEWGSRVFDWGRPEVRAFLVSSARWWIEEYHVDGLRVDAVASMLYRDYGRSDGHWVANRYGGREHLEAIDVIRQLTTEIHSSLPGAIVVAEESTSWPGVTRSTSHGGLGFDLKWDLGWMHDMLEYLGHEPIHRQWHQDDLTFRAMYHHSERFVLPLSHDEVVHGKGSLVNKMSGDEWQRRANLRLLFGHQYAMPGAPLVFMGGELAMNEEWNHDSVLPWYLLDYAHHRGVQQWLAECNRLLRTQPALSARDADPDGFQWIDCSDRSNSVIVWLRRSHDPADTVVIASNFTPVPRDGYRIGLPQPGRWRLLANSDDQRWGGSGYPVPELHEAEPTHWGGWPQSAMITLPPLGMVVLGQA